MPDHSRILLGAMSGTSADGVDVAGAEISGRGIEMKAKYLAHVERPYDAELRRRIFAIRESGSCSLEELAKLGREITLAYAAATRDLLKQMSLDPQQVAGLAAHGQTLFHAPPDSIQWLDPALLAAQTGLAVISDFRRADLAAGGQGAPLVPFADWILFRHPEKTRVILNIGGIANLTYLPAGGGIENVVAFDTGPGNCVSDYVCRTRLGQPHDERGDVAWTGKPISAILTRFLEDPFFQRRPPRSTDTPQMIDLWNQCVVTAGLAEEPAPTDLLATAVNITAFSVIHGLGKLRHLERLHPPAPPVEYLVAGGGSRNFTLVKKIEELLLGHDEALAAQHRANDFATRPLMPIDTAAMPSSAREAVAFAILGAATLDGEPSNVPSATGARRRVILGSITPSPLFS